MSAAGFEEEIAPGSGIAVNGALNCRRAQASDKRDKAPNLGLGERERRHAGAFQSMGDGGEQAFIGPTVNQVSRDCGLGPRPPSPFWPWHPAQEA